MPTGGDVGPTTGMGGVVGNGVNTGTGGGVGVLEGPLEGSPGNAGSVVTETLGVGACAAATLGISD